MGWISVEVFVLKIVGLSICVKMDVLFVRMDGLGYIVKIVRILNLFFCYCY